jgi:hypothetical protein
MDRRSFLVGLGLAAAAPAIVRADHIMPIRALNPYYERCIVIYEPMTDDVVLRIDRATFPLWMPPVGRGLVDVVPISDIGRIIDRRTLERLVSPPPGVQRHLDINTGGRYLEMKQHLASGAKRPFFDMGRAA